MEKDCIDVGCLVVKHASPFLLHRMNSLGILCFLWLWTVISAGFQRPAPIELSWGFIVGQGRAGQGRAGQGRAGQGRAGQGRAGQGRAGLI